MTKAISLSCIDELRRPGPPIIIVTTVYEAEAILNACRDHKIDVYGFCDSEKRKTQTKFCGLEVMHTPTLPHRIPEARFVIASQHVQDVADQLAGLGYKCFYSGLELLEEYDVLKHEHMISNPYMETRLSVYRRTHKAYFDEDAMYMRSLDVVVTTKCSLKCESCSNLMQYYEDPTDSDLETTMTAIQALDNCVDHISEFRIIGGEPLMNKRWADIVNGIIGERTDRKVVIYTNGSIAPRYEQLESFSGKDVSFVVTNYGQLSRNLGKLTDRLSRCNLDFVSQPADNWLDCSRIKHHKRSSADLKEVFKQCCVKYVYTLLDGRLFRCPFIANAAKLNAIPDNSDDYVDLVNVLDKQDLKVGIRRLIQTRHFFPGCDFCDGRPYDPSSNVGYDGSGMIQAGIQTAEPLPYRRYS